MKNTVRMMVGAAVVAAAFGAAAASGAQTMASLPDASAIAGVTGEARPVLAWVDFCRRNPVECALDPAHPTSITLTPRIWQTIVATNRKVNSAIKPVTDQEHWGVVDRWDFPDDGYGDCEDYQLLKRKLLVERGLPRRALRMTVVIDEEEQGHAVLMVRTDRGDFILDNKRMSVLPWQQTNYVFVKREGQDSLAWVSLNGVTSPTVTANR